MSVTNIDEPPDLSGPAAVDYDENNRGTVASYTAVDPERATITWTPAGDDQDDFRISSRGVLTFTDPPDYETPTDSNVDSTYEVTVQASDGTNTPTQTVSVRVTNLDEGGTVTLTTTTSRPQVDTVVEAALDDPTGESATRCGDGNGPPTVGTGLPSPAPTRLLTHRPAPMWANTSKP